MRAQAWLLIFSLPAEIIFGMFPGIMIPPAIINAVNAETICDKDIVARFLL